jgi:hypothetical protein
MYITYIIISYIHYTYEYSLYTIYWYISYNWYILYMYIMFTIYITREYLAPTPILCGVCLVMGTE